VVQHRGYYCPRCEVRYVAHACKDHLPCRHPFRDAFYVFRWDYRHGYKRFIVQNTEYGIDFDVRYVTKEELQEAIEKYCEWLRYQVEHDNIMIFIDDKSPIQVFREACLSAGGLGADYPPKWRIKELNEALEKAGLPRARF
jgi:hypothetical protein